VNTCDKCKYWSAPKVPYSRQIFNGECAHSKFVYSSIYKGIETETPEDGLMYWDYDDYSASFYTGPKFGCIHWEKE
jgi:hypothetical protein